MKKLVQYFINFPIFAYLIIPILLIFGIGSYFAMKRSFFPELESRQIVISVFYPGASPKEMEEGITMRIEQAVRGIVGIKEINSTSSENMTSVNIETTGEYDIDETLIEVKNAVDGISSFPLGAERPVVFKQRSRSFAMFLSVIGDVDLRTLKQYAYDIEDDFLASGLISQVTVQGFPAQEISVEVTEETLLRYGLTFDDIQRAISMNNMDIAAGQIKSKQEEILIRSRYRTVEPADIGNIIVRASKDGDLIRIRDLGTVKITFADQTMGFTQNGIRGVSINVQKLPEEDLEKMSEFVDEYVEEFNAENPEVHLEINFQFLTLLEQRLEMLLNNGLFGLLLVVIALAIFLNIYLSFWVAWGIPASFLAMFVIGNLTGMTINMISLFGMILVIGILVDDGIVIGENIFTHFEKGKHPKKAALHGTLEVMPAVTTSVATTIIAFLPVVLIQQGGMEFMHDMAFVVIVSLAASLYEAFFVLPAHLAHKWVLKRDEKKNRVRQTLDNMIDFLKNRVYGYVLKTTIRWKWVTVLSPIALILITIGLFRGGFIEFTFFPNVDFDTVIINFSSTPGTGEEKTIEYLEDFEQKVWEINDELKEMSGDTATFVEYVVALKGMAFDGDEMGSHSGRLEIYFDELDKKDFSAREISEMIRKKIGDVPELEKFSVQSGFDRWGKPVSISLLGDDLDRLFTAKMMLIDYLKKNSDLKNIKDNTPLGKQEINIKLKPEAYIHGLTQVDISNQIRQGFFGGQAQRLQHGKDELRVWVRYPKEGRMSTGQLENIKIKTRDGEYPLMELVDYSVERSPVSIKRYNVSREAKVEADLVDPTQAVPPILERIEAEVIPQIQALFPEIDVVYRGQAQSSREASTELMIYFPIALLVIILLLIIHFKSFSQMIVIMLMIPLGWLGSLWGHGFRGIPVSMLSAWGMVALTGVIINDAVVFMAKFNSYIAEGQKITVAVFKTGKARFRAILLTTITTTLGLLPLVIETSFQAQFLIPMAVALAFGVMIGTGFILLFLPSLILIWNDGRCLLYRIWWGGKKECIPEELEPGFINAKRERNMLKDVE
jgi:multidrug efflux pump subunit AcrB